MFKSLFIVLCFALPAFADVYGPGIDNCDFSATAKTKVYVSSTLATQVKTIFQTSCASCHGPGTKNGGIDNILVRDNLVRDGFINIAKPDQSKLYKAVFTDKMPLVGTKLTADQKKVILDWISAGAEDWDGAGPVTPTGFVSYKQELQCILQDVRAVEYAHRGDSRNYEWFQLTNVYNGGDPTQFQNLGYALDKALNMTAVNVSKGTAAGKTVASRKVDSAGVIRAVFAPDVDKDAVKDFDQRLLVDGGYPFHIDYTRGNYLSQQDRDDIKFLESEITRLTGRALPYIRADFTVNQVTLLQYYEFLGVDIKRQKVADVEKVFGVNTFDQIFNYENRALGNKRSGVSNLNRIVHQYISRYSLGGNSTTSSYWKTFDISNAFGEVAFRNLFAFPIGPQGSKFDNFATDNLFQFDAGESIGQLPNGEMFFLVSDVNGVLLREADPAIVFDAKRNHPIYSSVINGGRGAPGVIVNGGGCVSCHAGGMNYFVDEVADNTSTLASLNSDEYNVVRNIYPAQTYWDAAFKTFSNSYKTANAAYITDPKARVESSEPITVALNTFLGVIPAKEAAAEFGVTESDLLRCLTKVLANDVKRGLGFSASKGTVTRDGLDNQFAEIAKDCGYGRQILFVKKKPGPVVPPTKPACKFSIVNRDAYVLNIRAKGDTKVERIMPGVTKNGDGEIDIEFWIGTAGHPRMNTWNAFHIGCQAYDYFGDGNFK